MALPQRKTTQAALSGEERRVLENDLRSYAHSLIGTHVVAEYNEQIRKWQMHLNRVVDAQQNAYNNHKDVFSRMAAEDGMAMLALSFVAGPMFSWLSHSLQASLSAKFGKYVVNRPEAIAAAANGEKTGVLAAKVFGDLVNSTVKVGTDRVFKLQAGTGDTGPITVPSDGKIESFKTVVENALLREASLRSAAILNLAMEILNDPQYGQTLVDMMYRNLAGSVSFPYERQEAITKGMIRIAVNEVRAKWARDWTYFGNDPKQEDLYLMSKKIEIEIWALWILKRKYHLYDNKHGGWGPVALDEDANILREAVVNRLVDLDVVLVKKLKQASWVSTGASYESKEAAKEQAARREKDPSIKPAVSVEGDFDTEAEIKSLNDWAANHPPELLGGAVQWVPRTLVSIEHIHAAKKP
ncbi:MAG: hypothetical protein JST93_25840 [Acidobacteria bacterium]|nr:hypothetical protein [Acidobacteriota bacterium]